MEEHKHVMEAKWENDKVRHLECGCGMAWDEAKVWQTPSVNPANPLTPTYYPQAQHMQQPRMGKPFEAKYRCHNCGKEFKKKFPFGTESPDSATCPICGISNSIKLTWI